ncbi:hypothetical protein ACFVAJ_20320 [Agromyces sp. NPDC057679]|uniref:hypothetical protein n=1 Tax=Agromyces sp. NPDC057679 TaxID=3346207 RepID=UPI00366D0107
MSQQTASSRASTPEGGEQPPLGLSDPAFAPSRLDARWRGAGSLLSWLVVASLVAVVLGELDRLITSVPGSDGRSHSLNVLLTPLSVTQGDSWSRWADAPLHVELGFWIIASAVIDFALVLAIIKLGRRAIGVVEGRPRRVPEVALAVYLVSEVAENAAQIVAGGGVMAGSAAVAAGAGLVMILPTLFKVVALVVLVVAILRLPDYRAAMRPRFARLMEAIWVHRLATLAIAVIAVLSCIPASDLLDQLPDVQRQWADRLGWTHALWAGAALLATALVNFVLGRRRTRLMVEIRVLRLHRRRPERRWHSAAPWCIAPGIVLAAGLVALVVGLATGGPIGIHLPTFLSVFVITGAVPVLAAVFHPAKDAPREDRLDYDPERAAAAWIVGDALAVLVIAVGSIGVVRSFFIPFVLGIDPGVPSTFAWSVPVVLLGSAVAVAAPRVLPRVRRWNWGRAALDPVSAVKENAGAAASAVAPDDGVGVSAATEDGPARPPVAEVADAGAVEWIAFIVGAAVLALALVVPSWLGWGIGSVAAALVAISAWVTVFGAFTLIVQPRELIAPFRWLGLKAPPVLTLGFLVPFVVNIMVSSIAADSALHAVQVSNDGAAQVTSGLPTTIDERLDALQHDDCAIDITEDLGLSPNEGDEPVTVRPVFLIAAEGGGIRAAYWTAAALAELDGCAATSGLVANGISGGSLGLAIASTIDADRVGSFDDLDDPASAAESAMDDEFRAEERSAILEAARKTSGPDVVSTAVLGLTVGDAFAAGTGVRIPSFLELGPESDDPVQWRWRDRAAFVEALWERGSPTLAEQFSPEISPLTGSLILSSTDVVSRCRLLVDQAPFVSEAAAEAGVASSLVDQASDCEAVGGNPSMLGFRDLQVNEESDPESISECLMSLDWSTAVMLSARFAIITPTGGLPGAGRCDVAKGAQFVDGGYVEPTSLAALADLSPLISQKIAEHNGERVEGEPWLLPTLVYLRNTQGYDLAEDVARAESEPLVPITGGAAKTNLTAEDSWIQRITLAAAGACPDGPEGETCEKSLGWLHGDEVLPGGTVVVAPDSTPGVVPPLGWALSDLSRARFDAAIASDAVCRYDEPTVVSGGYAGLARLLTVMPNGRCAGD